MRHTALTAPALLLAAACGEVQGTISSVQPGISVSPLEVDFGIVPVGTPVLEELVVSSRGRAELIIDVVRLEGEDKAAFAFDGDPSGSLASGRSRVVTVRFTPAEASGYAAELVFFHSATAQEPIRVSLAGTGTITSEPPPPPPPPPPGCTDADLDGHGEGCALGPDCDDGNGAIHPGATDVCNGASDDCDAEVDEDATFQVYAPDGDGDGYGANDALLQSACAPPEGYAPRLGDCDDALGNVNPGATEVCTGGLDEDCNMLIDDADPACVAPPMTCTSQDSCGLNANQLACPLDGSPAPICEPLCRTDAECPGEACRPLPGSTSLGYCGPAGPIAERAPCVTADDCAVGLCLVGTCRPLCQTQADCFAGEECGVALYDASELGGASQRRMSTVCRPVEGGRRPIGDSCTTSPTTLDTGICNTGHCDFLAWAAQLVTEAPCAPVCAGAGDCGAQQVCGLVYNGLAETPTLPSTNEAAGRYFEGMFGCYTPVFQGVYFPPGTGALGSSCDSTQSSGRFSCRSHQCAQFAPIRDRCTDFCDQDSDCTTPATPNWRCRVGEVSLTGVFLQEAGIADITKFSLVGVCSP